MRSAAAQLKAILSCSGKQNLGLFLEGRMYHAFQSMDIFQSIQYEDELIKKFGFQAASIDYVLETGDGLIVIQLKWSGTRRRENNAISNFLKSVDYIQKKITHKPIIFGVWASRVEPFEDNRELLQKNKVFTISDYDDIDGLVQKTKEFLYKQVSHRHFPTKAGLLIGWK